MTNESLGANRIEPAFDVDWQQPAAGLDANMAMRERVDLAWQDYHRTGGIAQPIDLGIGAIADDEQPGRVWVPNAIREVGRERAFEDTSYAGSVGVESYLREQGRLVFGDEVWEQMGGSKDKQPETLAWLQTSGGTGALHRSSQYLEEILSGNGSFYKTIMLDPGWGNHQAIFANLRQESYQHQNRETGQYDHESCVATLVDMPDGTAAMFQVCGYNGDGLGRNNEQWDQLIEICLEKKMNVVLDIAYNGLVDGLEEDNYAVKAFAASGLPVCVCVSNSKNAGLYGESRTGALYIANLKPETATNVQSYLANKKVRPTNSQPSTLGAKTVAEVLESELLLCSWEADLDDMATRMAHVRDALVATLEDSMPERDLVSLRDGRGLFAQLPAWTREQLSSLEGEGVFAPQNGRVNVGGITYQTLERAINALQNATQLKA